MAIVPLDYEQVLNELHGFVGTRVSVSITHAETDYVAATLMGPLHSAETTDLSQALPVLEGAFAGESVLFRVVDVDSATVLGGFALWRGGFEEGRKVARPHGFTISVRIAGLWIRVMPAERFDELLRAAIG